MTQSRDRWKNRTRFILAAIGCSVGLGNVWRFPYIAYTNGGGAFLIPYMVALFTAGIPLLILEFAIGQRSQRSGPGAMKSLHPKVEWIGWWGVGISMVIVIYYAVIMAWAWDYLFYSFNQSWGGNAESFFNQAFLHISKGPGVPGSFNYPVFFGLIGTWLAIYLILVKGLDRVGNVVLWSVPLPVVLLTILVIRGVTLDGALEGISYYLTPDFSKLLDPKVWLAAYGQVFFSVGIGWGIMVAYASYQPRNADVSQSAFITAILDGGISFFAGFAVFSIIGYLAQLQGLAVPDAVTSSFGLAFVTYPTAISALPFGNALFGAVFFLMLLSLGIDSAFAMVEAVIAASRDRWNIGKKKATLMITIPGFLLGLPFCFSWGIHWLDIVDHWISAWGLAVVGLAECLIAGWLVKTEVLRNYINEVSRIKIGKWWDYSLKWITPAVLIIMIVQELVREIGSTYGGYPLWSVIIGGWMVVATLVIVSLRLQMTGRESD